MANVKFKMSRHTTAGRGEILARFVAGRLVDVQCATRIFVPRDKWNDADGTMAVSTRYISRETRDLIDTRHRLDDLRAAIMDAYFADPSSAVTRDWLSGVIERFHNPSFGTPTRTPMSQLVDEYVSASAPADGTRAQYMVLKRMLLRFEQSHNVTAESFTSADIDSFMAFIATEHRVSGRGGRNMDTIERGRNTIASKMKKFRSVCNWAFSRGSLPNNPFIGYKIPSETYGTPVFLTIAERDQIASSHLPDALAVQRDIFIFQCHVGCRVSDLMQLRHDNIVQSGDVWMLQYIPRKTARVRPETISVPLDDVAHELVARYANADPVRLLPFISMAKYNDAIKSAIRMSGVDRMVVVRDPVTMAQHSVPIWTTAASHLARRTFAANLFKLTHSERIVASMTGHAPNSGAISRYLAVDDELKIDAISRQQKMSGANPTSNNPENVPENIPENVPE